MRGPEPSASRRVPRRTSAMTVVGVVAALAVFGGIRESAAQATATGTSAQAATGNPSNGSFLPEIFYPDYLIRQGYFFVGGHYVNASDGQIMVGQMYVEYQIPAALRRPYPIVMIHGAGQTGTNFEGTPDGRPGWRDYFLSQGYAVYVVDQPGRGRSAYHPDQYGPTSRSTTLTVEQMFTAPELFNLWPQAHLHTQWPGSGPNKGQAGDPIFDQFYASQVESIANAAETELLNKAAGAALLDQIGPAIVMVHSQSGTFGWQIVDARPALVKGLVAVEPSGPPFYGVSLIGPPNWFSYGALSKPWGITITPITYDGGAVTDPSQLTPTEQATPDNPDVVRCWLQAPGSVHQLTTLQGVPILMITSEASYHASYDHCTSEYLTQAGVPHTYIRLPDVGIHGNGHMMMLEKDNLRIAALIAQWANQVELEGFPQVGR